VFIDETEIVVSSGRGGDGMLSFRREKYIPRGGPDGGDGGNGGDVVLRAMANLNTLAGIQHLRHYKAEVGRSGGTANKTGRRGESLVIELPVGTLVRDAERGHVLRDLKADGDEVVIAAGGRGGRGNKSFASSTNRTPRQTTQGKLGETRRLSLELRLVADVGLLGLPNAGKSTFLSRVSSARPKVADYPFTTLSPVLGLVDSDDKGMVIADIPGLIEGAHDGAGLGDRFLRHVARTRVLLHLVDGTAGAEGALEAWRTIRRELDLAGLDLGDKPELLAVTKADAAPEAQEVADALAEETGAEVVVLSSVSGAGLAAVLGRLRALVDETREEQASAERPRVIPPHKLPDPEADEDGKEGRPESSKQEPDGGPTAGSPETGSAVEAPPPPGHPGPADP
jgi:GTP-binding protein